MAGSLTGAGMARRAWRWSRLRARAGRGRTVTDSGLRLRFGDESGVERELRRLAELERACWRIRHLGRRAARPRARPRHRGRQAPRNQPPNRDDVPRPISSAALAGRRGRNLCRFHGRPSCPDDQPHPLARPARPVPGRPDDRAGHDHRERRAALDPRRPRLLRDLAGLGRERLPADLRRVPAARRAARRPVRPPPAVPGRHRALHRRLAGLRPGELAGPAHRRAGGAGRWAARSSRPWRSR